MSGTETGTPTYHPTTRSLRTGDKLNEANLRAPIQDLTDNDAFFNGLIGAGGAGTKRVFRVLNSTELQALVGLQEGDVIRVADQGIYVYHTSDGGQNTLAPKRYLITAGGIARASWHDATNVANGLAGLGTDGRVPNANLRGQVVATYSFPYQNPTNYAFSANASRIVIPSSGVLLSGLEDGDILSINASLLISNPGSGTWAEIYVEAATAADVSLSVIDAASMAVHPLTGSGVSGSSSRAMSGNFVVLSSYLTSGQMRLRLNIACNYSGSLGFSSSPHILHIRKP